MDLQKSDRWITELLWEIGIPMHVNGYYYLLTAVQLVLTLSQPCINLSRQLYPSIAQRFQTSPSCVERSIRHAIDMAWKRGNLAAASGLFGRIWPMTNRPTAKWSLCWQKKFVCACMTKTTLPKKHQDAFLLCHATSPLWGIRRIIVSCRSIRAAQPVKKGRAKRSFLI